MRENLGDFAALYLILFVAGVTIYAAIQVALYLSIGIFKLIEIAAARFDRWVDEPLRIGWRGWPKDLLDRYPDTETLRRRGLVDRTSKDTSFVSTCELCEASFKEADVLKLWQSHASHRRTRHGR